MIEIRTSMYVHTRIVCWQSTLKPCTPCPPPPPLDWRPGSDAVFGVALRRDASRHCHRHRSHPPTGPKSPLPLPSISPEPPPPPSLVAVARWGTTRTAGRSTTTPSGSGGACSLSAGSAWRPSLLPPRRRRRSSRRPTPPTSPRVPPPISLAVSPPRTSMWGRQGWGPGRRPHCSTGRRDRRWRRRRR